MGFQGDAVVTVEVDGRGDGKGDLSSSLLEFSKSPKAPEFRGDDMLEASPTLNRRDRRRHLFFCYARCTIEDAQR